MTGFILDRQSHCQS